MLFLSNEVTPHPDYLEEGPLSPLGAHYQESNKGNEAPFEIILSAIIAWLTNRGAEASV